MRTPTRYPEARERQTAPPPSDGRVSDLGVIAEHYLGAVSAAADAANLSAAQLFNPTLSQRVIVIDRLVLAGNASGTHELRLRRTPGATVASRWRSATGHNELGTGELQTDALAAVDGDIAGYLRTVGGNLAADVALGLILEPGRGLAVFGPIANSAVAVTFYGRERPL